MAEFQKVMKDFYRMCNTYYDGHCFDCPLSNNKNGKYIKCEEFNKEYTEKAEQIIEDWADKNPVMTNEERFKEVFGHGLHTSCYASDAYMHKCDSKCDKCLYFSDSEYHAPEGSEEE